MYLISTYVFFVPSPFLAKIQLVSQILQSLSYFHFRLQAIEQIMRGICLPKRWNSHVEKMDNIFESTFIDPFNLDEPQPHLVNFATGMVAMTAVEGSLTGALQKGC